MGRVDKPRPISYAIPTMLARSLVVMGILCGSFVLYGAGCQTPSAQAPTTPNTTSTIDSTASSAPVMSNALAFPGVRPAAELAKKVRIKTTKGDILIQINPEVGPNAASNFLYLVEQSFYQGTIFHRVIPGFMIQGGDPTGTGMGGPGYTIPDDTVNLPVKRIPVDNGVASFPMYTKGTVAMARTMAKNSAGSQFFIMVNDNALDPVYAVFGQVLEGQEIADAIAAVPRDEQDRPLEEIKMLSVTIE